MENILKNFLSIINGLSSANYEYIFGIGAIVAALISTLYLLWVFIKK